MRFGRDGMQTNVPQFPSAAFGVNPTLFGYNGRSTPTVAGNLWETMLCLAAVCQIRPWRGTATLIFKRFAYEARWISWRRGQQRFWRWYIGALCVFCNNSLDVGRMKITFYMYECSRQIKYVYLPRFAGGWHRATISVQHWDRHHLARRL